MKELFGAEEKSVISSAPDDLGDCIKPGTKRTKDAIPPEPIRPIYSHEARLHKQKKRKELKEAIQPSPY